jgi:hydrogenase maturation protease
LVKLKKTLILGYGNLDRQDDGVSWHILVNLAKKIGVEIPHPEDDIYSIDGPVGFIFTLQLYPELSEEIASFDRVCFVDAHTGAVKEDVHFEILAPQYQTSPLTHHMTPNTVLEITKFAKNVSPEAVLVSVRGYEFGFEQSLSSQTEQHAREAVDLILGWINQ